jgi:rod shape-determining protein MreD
MVFLLGLLTDLLAYAPPGISVLSLLIVHGLAVRGRRALVRQGFLVVWLSFSLIAFAISLLQWALTSVLVFRLMPATPAFFQAALAAGLYPALAVLLTRAHQTLENAP